MTTAGAAPPPGTTDADTVSLEELQLATRNHGMPLEALTYDVTPVGLHYLLVHYDIPVLDADTHVIDVAGVVERPLRLTVGDLRERPAVRRRVTMECAGNGRARLRPRAVSQPWLHEAVGNAEWTGTPLAPILAAAAPRPDAVEVVFTGADRGVEGGQEQPYERSLSLADATADDVLLVYELNGQPLPPQHGHPVRLLVPGWYGMASVKWLRAVTVVDRPFAGYQQARAYRLRQAPDEPGEPLSRIAVRSLMVPPGIPEFLSRRRVVDRAPQRLRGRAWSGSGAITRVEVSVDGGATWAAAELDVPGDPRSWAGWSFAWTPTGPGEHVLVCRATDATGATQPLEPSWNLGGYAVNAVHRVDVVVR